VFCLELYLG